MFFLEILLTISSTGNIIFKIGNHRAVENIFPENKSHDLWKSKHVKKLVRSDSEEKFY